MAKKTLSGVTLPLALMDFIPVIFFFITTILIAIELKKLHFIGGLLFYIGGILSFLGGFLQALWKLIIAFSQKNISIFHTLFKYFMSIGFLLIIDALIISRSNLSWKTIKSKLMCMPCLLFIIIIVICITLMTTFIFTLDSSKIKTHWIEEGVNIIFQGCVCTCVYYAIHMKINQVILYYIYTKKFKQKFFLFLYILFILFYFINILLYLIIYIYVKKITIYIYNIIFQ